MKITLFRFCLLLATAVSFSGCASKDSHVPTVGFVDAFEDNTIAQAKDGFIAALKDSGFSADKHTLNLIYRNAQGNAPTLTQIVKYFISEKVDLMATNPSLSTITAIQNTHDIPVFMMVSPTPALMKLGDTGSPLNLFGVGEQLDYIDTSFSLISSVVKPARGPLTVGMIYNQSEPQSVDALNRIKDLASRLNVNLVYLPVNSSADVKLVTESLLHKGIDAFFANPDNTVFASFETILKSCNTAGVPIFTSEAGLVARGAVAAYGADMYQWGYQSGAEAAQYLKWRADARASGRTVMLRDFPDPHWQLVKVRKHVYNPEAASRFHLSIPSLFVPIKP
jgi:putative ABC transport system substrate-binding protein